VDRCVGNCVLDIRGKGVDICEWTSVVRSARETLYLDDEPAKRAAELTDPVREIYNDFIADAPPHPVLHTTSKYRSSILELAGEAAGSATRPS
jgi:hypothetical protein